MKRMFAVPVMLGCASMADLGPQIKDWPEMTVITHVVSEDEMHRQCGDHYGCAKFDFPNSLCHIFITHTGDWVHEHELGHCRGRQHIGSNDMREFLNAYHRQGYGE